MRTFIAIFMAIIGLVGLCLPAFSAEQPTRVVTVGAPATEIVFALGAGDSVVATDTTSTRPDPVTDLPKVGYMRQLAAEGIISLKPDLIIAVEKSGPDTVLSELSDLGVKIVKLPSLDQMENLLAAIDVAGKALGRMDEASTLTAKVSADIEQLATLADGQGPSMVFLMAVGHGQPLSSGANTTAAEVINLVGARNSMTGFDGFKPVSPEVIAADQSDYVLVPETTLEQLGGVDGLKSHPILGLHKAVAANRVMSISGSTILGFGPASAAEIRKLADALHKAEAGQ
ncbi:ABC transporter substrate-binding protein [Thalassospira sp. MA62]|nr:ABC transporter substrate-binding protein [Thalassospira sp. MA62]